MKKSKYTFYAIATKQQDGSWYPWSFWICRNKKSIFEKYKGLYGKDFCEQKDLKVKRFYIGTK